MANGRPGIASTATMREQLAESQASLASALARLETYRARERALLAEIDRLYAEAEFSTPTKSSDGGAGGGTNRAQRSSSGDVHPFVSRTPHSQQRGKDGRTTHEPPPSAGPHHHHQHNNNNNNNNNHRSQHQQNSTQLPAYICHPDDDHAMAVFVESRRKVAGAIAVGDDHIDVLQVRARVRRDAFVSITPAADELGASRSEPGCFGSPRISKDYAHATPGYSLMQLTWLDHTGGRRRQLFQADPDVRDRVMALADKWAAQGCGSGGGGGAGGTPPPPGARTPGGASQSGGHTEEDDSTFKVQLAPPTHMQAGPPLELTGDAPQLLTPSQLELLGGAIPVRFRSRAWRVAYSTRSHGISLGNLYRRVSPGSPTITLIRDNGGHVFGCFTTDGWKVQPRYYGGGETFVFNLEPHRLTWPWVTSYHEKNDFFQYSQPDCLALGGAGRFALWLDEDLLCGTSGPCGTFGCGCLAHAEDFRISMVEVLQAAD